MKKHILVFLMVISLAACTSKANARPELKFENPYAPQAADSDLMAGDIKVDSTAVFLSQDQTPQLMVDINYFPPTPCYQLRVEASGPDEQNQIQLKAYAVAEKDKPCNLMALATPQKASLNLGSLPAGHYTVFLNGGQIGEFDS